MSDPVQRLLDLEEIRALKARYCRFSDRGYEGAGDSPAQVAQLFTEDGAWGDTRGREAIEKLFEDFQRMLPFALHLAINPEIELDGDRASAHWWGVIPATTETGEAMWIGGVYDDALVRTDEGWRFTSLRFTAAFQTRHPESWGAP